jgi:predicted molibdopterin-dependent oxidoreductase YjgC
VVTFVWNGAEVTCSPGMTLAGALVQLAGKAPVLHTTARCGQPRTVFCGMGLCHECVVQVDGRPNVRACVTLVRDGMRVSLQDGDPGLPLQVPAQVPPQVPPQVSP